MPIKNSLTKRSCHHGLRLRTVVVVSLLLIQPPGVIVWADAPADPYDTLYDVIMVRKDPDGNAYAADEVGPLIYGRSSFPFDNETYPNLKSALEQFRRLTSKQIKSYGTVRRAMLQRHLWVVFDATMPKDYKTPTHLERRRSLQPILATLIRRIALTKDEILALPDTRKATIQSGRFPREHDPTDHFKPFLPVDLYERLSSWVCLGKAGNPDTDHAAIDRWRSAFFQFIRLPEGRKATLRYTHQLNDREQFPIGTQFALIDQAFLISNKGELVLSPLINSIQLRAYLTVTESDLAIAPKPTACVAEFVLQPKLLIEGNAVMKALGSTEFRFQTIASGSGGLVDPLEARSVARAKTLTPAIQGCTNCHTRSRAGVRSLGDFMFGNRYADKLTFEPGDPDKIAQSVAASKHKDASWHRLRELWPED